MTNGSDERILVERVFDLGLPVDTVWALLAQVEQWPEWAPHIRRARLDGEGTLGPESQGQFQFWPAGSGRVHMTTWEPPHLWTWRGRVVGLPIIYHHHFKALPGPTTRLRWVVELAEGCRGPRANAFARVYARIIDRAWPRDSWPGLNRNRHGKRAAAPARRMRVRKSNATVTGERGHSR